MNAGFDGSIVVEKVKNEKGNFGSMRRMKSTPTW